LAKQAGWSRRFDEPIILPNGRKLITLRDAGGMRDGRLIGLFYRPQETARDLFFK
jgi:hypothetical protein